MSSVWLKNFFGLHCSDYELLKVPNPKLEFGIHVTFKTVQLGTLAGSLLLGPFLHILKYGCSDNKNQLSDASIRYGLYGAGFGLIAGPLLSIGYFQQNQSNIENYDQCYRLRYNGPQINIDRMSALGALIGGSLAGRQGFVAGVDVGVLCGLLLNGTRSVQFKI